MASPPATGERHWSASPWLPLDYAEVVRSPDTFGVVILGDSHRDPLLVSHGSIRNELWRLHRNPRIAAQGSVQFRYIETLLEREAELLAVIVRDELAKSAGHDIVWQDLPQSPVVAATPAEPGEHSVGR
jgi:hypothetical protein